MGIKYHSPKFTHEKLGWHEKIHVKRVGDQKFTAAVVEMRFLPLHDGIPTLHMASLL
jgi:hypothetical protein